MEKLFQLSRVKLFYKKILHDNEIIVFTSEKKKFL